MAPHKRSKISKPQGTAAPKQDDPEIRQGGIDVGKNAQVHADGDIVGRDKITNWITNINVPWWSIAIGVGTIIALIAGVFLYPQFKGPEKMTGAFNVVVADFGEQRAKGQPLSSSQDSRSMSDQVFADLESKISKDEYLKYPRVQSQHKNVGIVQGATPAERARAAGELAAQTNATVIIYGTIDLSATPYLLLPEFYVAPSFRGAEELVSQNAFGKPISIRLPLSDANNRMKTTEDLQPRVNAWSLFTLGLAYLQIEKPDRAVTYFQKAEDEPNAWGAESAGKEVLYLFKGAAVAKQGSDQNLIDAEKLYQKALDQTQGQYARAYLALGNISLQRIQTRLVSKGTLDFQLVDKAIIQYTRALTAEIKPPLAYADVKAYSNLGVVYGYKALLPGLCPNEEAIKVIKEPITAYEKNPQVELLRELGAQGYYQLGRQYEYCGNQRKLEGKANEATLLYDNAATQYQVCIQVATPKTIQEPGWFGLSIGAPAPHVDEADWQQLRWIASEQLAYTYFARADMGNPALYDQALTLYKANASEYEKQKARGSNAISELLAAEAYYNTGLILEKRDDKNAATQAYQRVLQIAPEKSSLRDKAQGRLRALGTN